MLRLADAFDLAVRNVARWGDTDVFPFAPEGHIFHDRTADVVALLQDFNKDLEQSLVVYPPLLERSLSLVTSEGFRWVSQIDPAWNAYFLGLVLSLAPEIESARLASERKMVFSYRLSIDDSRASLFEEAAWQAFVSRSEELSHQYDHIVICDIADFYGRIYHHRLENSLGLLPSRGNETSQIMKMLAAFADGPSYGLPVGGPAARILAELALNRTDRLLATDKIVFCRYADDYRLFANTREEAFRALVKLTEYLLRNEGLAIQRQKTKVLATKDFLRSPLFLPEESDELTEPERQERRFLRLSLRYDPYSATARDDFARLKHALEQFDILGMLTREVNKSRANVAVVRRLVQAIAHLDPDVRNDAAAMLIANVEVLAPALPVVLRVLEELMPQLPLELQGGITSDIRRRIAAQEYFITVPVNLAYALRVLQHDRSEENVALCSGLFETVPAFIQRDIVYLMHAWSADYWLSDKRSQWMNQHPWVKRAILLASYRLGDEGRYWRQRIANRLTGLDAIAREWMSQRVEANQTGIPL